MQPAGIGNYSSLL